MKKDEKCCQNCRHFTGWDGGFFGEPITTDCRHYGVTENRKDCPKFKRPYPRGFSLLVEFQKWFNNQTEAKIEYDDLLRFRKEWK